MTQTHTLRSLLCAAALTLAGAAAHAHSFKIGEIDIGHPYARTTAAGQPNGGGYLKLDNKGRTDDKLLSARAAVSASVELHSMSMEGSVMRMRQVDGIAVPAGSVVELKPGGLHIMFVGLKAPLKAGEVEVVVNIEVPKADGAAPAHQH